MNQKDLQLKILGYISQFDDYFIEKIRELKIPESIFDYKYRPIIRAVNEENLHKLVETVIPLKEEIQPHEPDIVADHNKELDLLSTYKQLMTLARNDAKITDQELVDAIQKDTREKEINLLTATDIMETEGKQEYIISDGKDFGMFPPAGVSAIVADPGTGKSFLCLDLCMKIAGGRPWLETYQTMKKNCLFIDEENGPIRLKERLDLMTNNPYTGHRNPLPENFFFLTFSGVNFLDPIWVKAITKTIQSNDIGFVVIDSFVDVFNGDENSVQDVQPVMHAIRTIATQTNSHFLLIHHTNKSQGTYRGSSAFNGAVDLMIQLDYQNPGNPKEGTDPDPKDGFIFHSTKARDTKPFKKFIDITNTGNVFGIKEKKPTEYH